MATEGIQKISYPANYQAAPLSTGEHTIYLHSTKGASGFRSELFIDDQLAITESHPPDWAESSGNSSESRVSPDSKAYPVDLPLDFYQMRYQCDHPTKKWGRYNLPDRYDSLGAHLWIAPKRLASPPPPTFIPPLAARSSWLRASWQWGHRQGITLVQSTESKHAGLVTFLPGYAAETGERDYRFGTSKLSGISFRPIVSGASTAESLEESPSSGPRPATRIGYAIRNSLEDQSEVEVKRSPISSVAKFISEDGKTMRLFLHFEPFPSGAKPIIEVIFIADRPDSIGFLVHQATDSTPIQAFEWVSRFDTRYQWQQVTLLPNVEHQSGTTSSLPAEKVTLSELAKTTSTNNPWLRVPTDRLPAEHDPMSKTTTRSLRFDTLVKNFDDTNKGLGLPASGDYQGIPNSQTWVLPGLSDSSKSGDNTDASGDIQVEVSSANTFSDTGVAVPSGAVVDQVRLTVPMPMIDPVWLRYEPAL